MTKHIEGVPVEIKFGKRTDTVFVHPDGVVVGDSMQFALKSERAQRAAKRVVQIHRRLSGGQLSPDEYEEALKKLDEQMTEGMGLLNEELGKGKISQKEFDETKKTNELIYRNEVDSLLNQKDGEPVSLDEEDKLNAELSEWVKRASWKPFAVPMLKSCILSWTLEAVDENGRTTGEPLPATHESLQSLPDEYIMALSVQVSNHYKQDEDKEKKPTADSSDISLTPTRELESETPQNGFRSIELPEHTGLTLTRLESGDSANSTAHSQN